ncbi:bifunctional hydroxymethylpyrimidine kinase/phosphomethylpyrimidine kinase [Sulfurisphaera ohwakuensis]|uniref:Hydroxymethylpyrimidine kinase/phosphomethylpyrimidine kinase n=2 Tax=Sulfurisphaera ohwakuensis TaxID=69656 RepID=A0A7J9RT00_SULOH|nr:bifunctional hydroxymethylpyrimidine kinase/phosphomethylpyrimidine kinase [Sulfurisphaera ohwakuensis]MBB5253895.1 hydroxymethylpyrimidine kinase/phosphomethylpyrimidine kinase [Sulfurisphaera ohwakuensis]
MIRPVAMTIAGSDSGGGAGLQADLKTFTSLGVFGTVIVTGLTAQNTFSVTNVLEVPPEFIEAQFDAVMVDLKPKYAKTGMLASSKVINAVMNKVIQYNISLVLDPVMIAKSGAPLVTEDTIDALKKLIKHSLIITPNKFEAEKLSGIKITDKKTLIEATRKLYEMFNVNVIVKGGSHVGGFDFAIVDGKELELEGESINTKNTHGSGDVFSASLTAYLAKGEKLEDALIKAKEYVTISIKYSLDLGQGHGPVDPFAPIDRILQREFAREELERLLWEFEKDPSLLLQVIEDNTKSNVAFLTDYGDVATLAGGIIKYLNKIKLDGPILINIENDISTKIKKINKRVCISIALTRKVLNASEKGLLKISESGLDSDIVMLDGGVYLVGNSIDEILQKLRRIKEL